MSHFEYKKKEDKTAFLYLTIYTDPDWFSQSGFQTWIISDRDYDFRSGIYGFQHFDNINNKR